MYSFLYKCPFAISLACLALFGPAQLHPVFAQAQSHDKSMTAPVVQAEPDQNGPEVTLDRKPDLMPPALPPRTGNFPSAVAPALPSYQGWANSKQSLSWRQKALKLSTEKFKNAKNEPVNNAMMHFYSANYSDTLMALTSACADASFKVDSLNSNAGEVLASSNDGQTRLVFSIWEQPAGKTWISAGVDKGNTAGASKIAIQILSTTGNTIPKRGKI